MTEFSLSKIHQIPERNVNLLEIGWPVLFASLHAFLGFGGLRGIGRLDAVLYGLLLAPLHMAIKCLGVEATVAVGTSIGSHFLYAPGQ